MRRLMPECFDGIGVVARRVLGEPEKPVVPPWRMWIEASGVAQMFDTLDSLSLECLQLPQERPGIGMIGVDPKGRGQFRRAFIWCGQRPGLIRFHEAAVANDICRDYGGESTLDAFLGQRDCSRLKAVRQCTDAS